MKKVIFTSVLLLFSILVLVACNDDQKVDQSTDSQKESGINETIKIGLSAPMTGPISYYGEGATRAIEIAIDEWNEEGGINGQNIELITYDDQSSADRASSNIQQLIQKDKIHAGFVPIGSASAMAALPHAVSSKLPFVNTLSQTIEITYPDGTDKEPYPNIFTFAMQNDSEALAMGNAIIDSGFKTVALLGESTPYGQSGLDLVEKVLEDAAVQIVGREQYDQQATSVTAQLAKLNKEDPEALLFIGLASDSGTIIKDMNRLDMDIPVIVSASNTASQFVDLVGELAVGVRPTFIPTFGQEDMNPAAQNLVDKYIERHGKDHWFNADGSPSAFFILPSNHYDAINFILESIKEADSLDKNDIVKVMNETEYDSTTLGETIQFTNGKHHAIESKHFSVGEYVKEDGTIKLKVLDE